MHWKLLASPPPLDTGIHIWRARAEVLGCAGRPSGARNREMASKFLERLLRAYLGREPVIHREDRGRPFVPGKPLDFNISHSGDFVAGAFTRIGRVGLDIERMRPDRDLVGIAQRFFAPEEAQDIKRGPLEVFYRLWTAKEAALKMTGQGLSGGLDRARPVSNGANFGMVRLEEGRTCPVLWFEPAQGFAGAIVHEGPALPECGFYELG